jgi:hypothetical protein
VNLGSRFSIDESIVPYYGTFCPLKVYMKSKPYKYGIKFWANVCADTFWCVSLVPFHGAGSTFPGEGEEERNMWGFPERVVLCMLRMNPEWSYNYIDRYFTTPALCAYAKNVLHKFLTGTMTSTKTGLDKSIIFPAKSTIPRGYYRWSEDEILGVIQCCWMDRKPVLLCSNVHGAQPWGVERFTSQTGGRGHLRDDMEAPRMALEYNEHMNGADVSDGMCLSEHYSWQRRTRSKRWWVVCKWAIQTTCQVNSYGVFRRRASPRTLTHDEFYERLMIQWYNMAYYKMAPAALRRAGLHMQLNDFHSMRPMPVFDSRRERVPAAILPASPPSAELDVSVGHLVYKKRLVKYEGAVKRLAQQCWVCKKQGNVTKSTSKRLKTQDDGQQIRLPHSRTLVPKSSQGCAKCKVVLCSTGHCWKTYHREFFGETGNVPTDLFEP